MGRQIISHSCELKTPRLFALSIKRFIWKDIFTRLSIAVELKELLIVSLTFQCRDPSDCKREVLELNTVELSHKFNYLVSNATNLLVKDGRSPVNTNRWRQRFHRKLKRQTCRAAIQLTKQRAMFSSGLKSCTQSKHRTAAKAEAEKLVFISISIE